MKLSKLLWVSILTVAGAMAEKTKPTPPLEPLKPSKAQAGVTTSAALRAGTTITTVTRPLDLKLLVLTGDGTEPSFAAMKYFLDYIGTPYDAVIAKTAGLPALTDAAASKGYYQGIILVTGNLSINDNGIWRSALSATDWTRLDTYVRDFKVRTAAYYAFPEARFGLDNVGAIGTSDTAPA